MMTSPDPNAGQGEEFAHLGQQRRHSGKHISDQ